MKLKIYKNELKANRVERLEGLESFDKYSNKTKITIVYDRTIAINRIVNGQAYKVSLPMCEDAMFTDIMSSLGFDVEFINKTILTTIESLFEYSQKSKSTVKIDNGVITCSDKSVVIEI